MAYKITILLLIINTMIVLLKKNNKIIAFLSFSWLFVLFYGNTMNPDYSGYLWRYNAQNYYNSIEIGYYTLSNWAHSHAFDYQTLVLIEILITIPFIVLIFRKMKPNLNLVFVMYAITTFTLDVIQIRNYMACMIFSLAVLYLFEGKKKRYVLLVILATLFHTVFIIYLPFVFLSDKTSFSEKVVKRVLYLIIVLCTLALFSRNIILKPVGLISRILLGTNEKSIYFGSYINLGFILFFLGGIINILLSRILVKVLNSYEHPELIGEEMFSRVKINYLFNLLSSVFFPLLMLNGNFLRLLRNNCFVIIVVTASVILCNERYKKSLNVNGLIETKAYVQKRKILFQYVYAFIISFIIIWFVANGVVRYCPDILENNFILGIGER